MLTEAVERELAALGMLGSTVGNAALVMAALMADPNESASGKAAAAREFSRFMNEARRQGAHHGNALDALRARAARKRLAAITDGDVEAG